MRERWLYLLLCALLIRFNGGDNFVNGNEEALNRTSIDFSTAEQPFAHGEQPFNGTYSKSGLAKIRRVRSIEDEYNKAVQEDVIAMNTTERAAALLKETNEAIKDKEAEIGLARKNVTDIGLAYDRAEAMKNAADGILKKEETNLTNKQTAYNSAEAAFAVVITEFDKKISIERIWETIHKENSEAYESAEKARVAASGKTTASNNALEKATTAFKSLNKVLTTNMETLKDKIARSEEDDKVVKDSESIDVIENEKKTFTDNKGKIESERDQAEGRKKNLNEKKEKMEKNGILSGKSRTMNWKTMTVAEATKLINETIPQMKTDFEALEKKTPKDDAAIKAKGIELGNYRTLLKFLVDIDESFNLAGPVADLVNNHTTAVKELQAKIDAEDALIKPAVEQLKDYTTEKLTDIETRLSNKKVEVAGRHPNVGDLKEEARLAKERKEDNSKSVATARIEVVKQSEKIEDKEREKPTIATLTGQRDAYKIAENQKTRERDAAKGEQTKSSTKYGEAQTARTDYKKKEYKVAEDLKKKTFNDLTDATDQKDNAGFDYTSAEADMKEKLKEKTEAQLFLDEKIKEKGKLEEERKQRESTSLQAFNASHASAKLVKDLRQKLDDFLKDEEKRKSLLEMLKLGLGISVGLIVLIVAGAIIAFVLIRRRKKKAVQVKKPIRTEYRAENGLTVIQREGEVDQHVIKGEDFKIMGPLVRGRVHNTPLPDKHMLDDQKDGDKIDKITFPPDMNEAYFVGEGVEIMHADSVSLSEGRHLLDGVDMSPSRKDKPKKEKDVKSDEKDSKGNAPSSSEDKKSSDEKKPEEKKNSSSKSKRASDPNAKNVPSSPLDGKKMTEQKK